MIDSIVATSIRLFTGAQARAAAADGDGHSASAPRPRIYFANHTSMLDFVVLWSVLPTAQRVRTRPVAAHDHWSATALRRWMALSLFNAVLIERKHVTRASNPLDPLRAVLAAGQSLILFPEGGRQDGPVIGPFKSGLYHLASEHAAVELIPVYIDNLNRVLPKGEILPIPLVCAVTFGSAITLVPGETKAVFLERARAAVMAMAGPVSRRHSELPANLANQRGGIHSG